MGDGAAAGEEADLAGGDTNPSTYARRRTRLWLKSSTLNFSHNPQHTLKNRGDPSLQTLLKTRLTEQPSSPILSHMVQYSQTQLDASFAALSDATRRGVLEYVGCTAASITELAQRFQMTLTGMKKHVQVLEQAGLVTTEKVGRVRICRLGARRLDEEMAWLQGYRQLWEARFDELDKVVEELKHKEKLDGSK